MSQREHLARPFGPKLVKAPAQGKHGDYVAHDVVNQRLLLVCGPFDYRIVQTTRDDAGRVDGCVAELTITVDGRLVVVQEAGECDNPEVKKTNGERLKHASSDAFKRCAMRLGVGLHLWAGNDYFLHSTLQKADAEQPQAAEDLSAFSTEPF